MPRPRAVRYLAVSVSLDQMDQVVAHCSYMLEGDPHVRTVWLSQIHCTDCSLRDLSQLLDEACTAVTLAVRRTGVVPS